MRSFVCAHCQAITRRLEGALEPTFCPHCRKTDLFEITDPADPGTPPQADTGTGANAAVGCGNVTAVRPAYGATPALERVLERAPSPFIDDERPCDRGEPCARFEGKECPGGRGC